MKEYTTVECYDWFTVVITTLVVLLDSHELCLKSELNSEGIKIVIKQEETTYKSLSTHRLC